MLYSMGLLRKQIFGLGLHEGGFDARGFNLESEAQARLELVAKTVINAYNVALEEGMSPSLLVKMQSVKEELCGFFHEGVAMGLFTADTFSPFKKDRFIQFINGPAKNHQYMSHIGAGLAIGVFRLPFEAFMKKLNPFTSILVIDGIGFYHTFFRTKATLENRFVPKRILGNDFYLKRYYAGMGRALWFVTGADPVLLKKTIDTQDEKYRHMMWSGAGLACTYAGGVEKSVIEKMAELSSEHLNSVAIGSALASHARHKAGNPFPHNTLATEIFTGKTSSEVHQLATDALIDLDNKEFVGEKKTWEEWIDRVSLCVA